MNSLNQSFGLAIRINVGSRQHCGDLRIEVPAAASADVLSVDERLVRLLYSITCRWLVEGATGRIGSPEASRRIDVNARFQSEAGI